MRILVADDHDVVRVGLRALLESQKGWTICGEAATGREAVESAMQHQPDVAILDFSMPELNGLDATLQIRKSLPDTKVLIITMHDSEHLAREAHRAGAHGFLVKTDARRHLVMAVRALSEHKTFFVDAAPTVLLEQRRDTQSQSADSMGMENRLTPREREILQLVALGKPSKEIANVLGIRTKTVEAHRANIMNKLDLHSVSGLVRYAIREKMVEA